MLPIEHLHDLYRRHYRTTYPSVPEAAVPRPKYSDKTTNGLTKMIIDFIKFNGGLIWRVNVMGRQIKNKSGKEIWIPSSTMKGVADLSCIYKGVPIQIEVKCAATKDRIRPKQGEFADKVSNAGGKYIIARTFDEFFDWWNKNF